MSRYENVEQSRPLRGGGAFPADDTDLSSATEKWLEYLWRKLNARLPDSKPINHKNFDLIAGMRNGSTQAHTAMRGSLPGRQYTMLLKRGGLANTW